MKINSPCLNCVDRHPLCHSDCAKYLEFRKNLEEIRELEKKQKEREMILGKKTKKYY